MKYEEIDADMTNPAFVMRTAEADGHFLYTKMNEIDQFDALRGGGRGNQQFQIMCLSFDPGNRYGQTRVGTMSVTEKICIRFNWNAATTVLKGKRYFSRVLTDGPISRINFCTIPEALRLAKKLREECADRSRLSQNRVYENLSFRATVIAWLKACVLYVAAGQKWDKTIEDFVRWSLEYDLWCKMEFFGADIERAMSEGLRTDEAKRPGRMNLLELLPDEFTPADALRVRQQVGMDAAGTGAMLRQWVHRRYVTIVTINETTTYKKNEKWK